MKKPLVILFAAALLLALTAGALAAEVQPGAEVTFTLSLQNTNASYVRIKASYDTSVFELVNYSANNGTAGSAGIVMYDVSAVLPSGPVGSVTLRVKAGAKPGTYSVGAVLAECYDRDENNGRASASGGGTVTVPGSATPAPTAKPKPTDKATPAPTATPKPTDKATPAPTPTEGTTPPPPTPTPVPPDTDWRLHQSVCSLGIRFRDIAPQLTREWDMFTPLDLSQDGEQTLPLLAANVNEVGSVTIAVKDGAVTVTYKINWPAEELDMAFSLLPDLASVTEVSIAAMPRYAFGQPVSVQDDLQGDTRVLLYVLGYVNYDFLDPRNPQYCTNNTVYPQLVSDLKALMD